AEVAARWREHVDVSVLAPPGAAETLGPLIGDVPFHELGRKVGPGPALALEYVRRAVEAVVRDGRRGDVVAAASHFVPDAAAVSAGVRRGALGGAYVYHLVGERRAVTVRTTWSKGDQRACPAMFVN